VGIERENVERMMAWLTEDGPARSASSAAETVVARLAAVFGGDSAWPANTGQADSYRNALDAWLAVRSGGEARFLALTGSDADPGAFADGFLPLLDASASGEAEAAKAAEAQAAFSNPNFDGTSGTEFYRLDEGGQYLYAASADAADWVTYEQRRYTERERDENYGLDRRYDRTGGVYEWYDEAEGTWKDQAWADARLASAIAAAAQPTADTPAAAQADAPPEWDESWTMFYRVASGGAYEFADAVTPGDRSSGCGDVWLSQEEVLARNAANPQAESGEPAPEAVAVAEPEAVRAEVSATVDSVLAEMPELMEGLTREDIESVIADLTRDVTDSR
jgi:hypothetical protein